MKKQKPKCAVDGMLAKNAVCVHVRIDNRCGAHGNKKCEFKQTIEPKK